MFSYEASLEVDTSTEMGGIESGFPETGERSGVTHSECLNACFARISRMHLLLSSRSAIVFSTLEMNNFLRSRVILACILLRSRLNMEYKSIYC
jgi:hypothetical protein